MSSFHSVVFALLAGCHGLLGVDKTIVDTDRDGVADTVDNCIDTANADQFDSDGDGIGDVCASCVDSIGTDLDGDGYDDGCDRCIGAGPSGVDVDNDGIDDGCDPCLGFTGTIGGDSDMDGIDDGCQLCFERVGTDSDGDRLDDGCDACNGPPQDEDGDGIEDGCDNCPIDANADQATNAATDGDAIGSLCDPDEARDHIRVVFDPFLGPNTTEWTSSGDPEWTFVDGVAHVTTSAIKLRTSTTTFGTGFSVTTSLTRGPIGANAAVAIRMTANASLLTCTLASTGDLTLQFDPGFGLPRLQMVRGVDVSIPQRLRLSRDATPSYGCEAIGAVTVKTTGLAADLSVWLLHLEVTDGEVAFESIEALSEKL